MNIAYFQVNAFTQSQTGGNPAGVCVLDDWLPDEDLQGIAAENDLSETAYIIKRDDHYDLRWFTPAVEVDLCGHATLASAYVILHHLEPQRNEVAFSTRSGMLMVERQDEKLEMDFPAAPAQPTIWSEQIANALGIQPQQVLGSPRDLVVVLEEERAVRELKPRFELIARLDKLGVMVTAAGDDCDFVCRFFAPRAGIPEDPVTGSAYCTLAPYWSKRLKKDKLHARQLSRRGSEIWCEPAGDRVKIAGYATLYLSGSIHWGR